MRSFTAEAWIESLFVKLVLSKEKEKRAASYGQKGRRIK